MARERMVTRTVNYTEVEVLAVNVKTHEVQDKTINLSGDCMDVKPEKVLSAVNYQLEADFKAVNINKMTVKEQLYGMPEVDFIKLAKVLPPRGTTAE